MKRLLIIIFFTMLVASCGVKKKVTHTEYSDSVYSGRDSVEYVYREVIKDTTIYLPTDSAYIEALLECDSLGEVYIKEITDLRTGRHIKPEVRIVDNVIHVGCSTEDSVAISIYWKNIYESKYNEKVSALSVSNEQTTETKIVRPPWWLRLWWIWVVLGLVVFVAGKKFRLF